MREISDEEAWSCLDCGAPLLPCTCRSDCPGGMCSQLECNPDSALSGIRAATTKVRALSKENERIKKERNMFHALLCVVNLMDYTEDVTGNVQVFQASMPSLAALFYDTDNGSLWLNVAVERALSPATGVE